MEVVADGTNVPEDEALQNERIPLAQFLELRDDLLNRCGMTFFEVAKAAGMSYGWVQGTGRRYGHADVDRVKYDALLALKSRYDDELKMFTLPKIGRTRCRADMLFSMVERIRIETGQTREMVEKVLGVTYRYIASRESGKIVLIRNDFLMRLWNVMCDPKAYLPDRPDSKVSSPNNFDSYVAKIEQLCLLGHTKADLGRAFAARFGFSNYWVYRACGGECRVTDAHLAFLNDLIEAGVPEIQTSEVETPNLPQYQGSPKRNDRPTLSYLHDVFTLLHANGVSDARIASILNRSKRWVVDIRCGSLPLRIYKLEALRDELPDLLRFLPDGVFESSSESNPGLDG